MKNNIYSAFVFALLACLVLGGCSSSTSTSPSQTQGVLTAPSSIDFGNIGLAAPHDTTFTVTNSGGDTLVITKISFSSAATASASDGIDLLPMTIAPHGSKMLSASFTAMSPGTVAATETIDYTVKGVAGTATFTLTATGTMPNQQTGSMTATINGKPWTASAGGYRHAGSLSNCQFEGFITASFEQIAVSLSPDINSPGTYPFQPDPPVSGNVAWVNYATAKENYGTLLSGSVTVTALTSTNIQGTFNFMMKGDGMGDTVVLSNGRFNAPLN